MPREFEVQRAWITLIENHEAEVLWVMGRTEEAHDTARTALARLTELYQEMGDDFRLSFAQAHAQAVLGNQEETRRLVAETLALAPQDALQSKIIKADCARFLAIAGLAEDSVAMLTPLMTPKSAITPVMTALNPAFDAIREHPAFVAMMEAHQ